jgi:hypothetical protein
MDSATPNGWTKDGHYKEIACAVHSTHSSTREKALEHIFLGDLLRALWRMGLHDVEILRPEIDRNGYEFVIGCNGIRRSIQLKTTRKGGKAQAVTVNCRLATEPSGCVIWIAFDEHTLQLGPFLWLGNPSGAKLQELGDKVAKNTRGNKDGIKPARPGHRVVSKRRFTQFEDMHQLATTLFGEPATATSADVGRLAIGPGHEPQSSRAAAATRNGLAPHRLALPNSR